MLPTGARFPNLPILHRRHTSDHPITYRFQGKDSSARVEVISSNTRMHEDQCTIKDKPSPGMKGSTSPTTLHELTSILSSLIVESSHNRSQYKQ